MTRVFLHTRDLHSIDWVNEFREFSRVPGLNEYVALAGDSDWYRVIVVVHTPFPCECDAEVYAVKVDQAETRRQILEGVR